jgi:predicted RNA-binding protein with PIN domain
MSGLKTVIVDGYNLGHKLGIKVSPENLEFVRSKVESMVFGYCSKYCLKATVVYDGRGILSSNDFQNGISIEFTPSGKTADSRMKELIDGYHSKTSMLVVSSDHNIQQYARLSGFKFISSEQLIKDIQDQKKPAKTVANVIQSNAGTEKPKTVSNSELQDWLKLFNTK